MPLDDVESPPYPSEGATAQGLFNYIKQLRKWVLHYRDDTNEAVGQEIVPALVDMPDKRAYLSQPVFTQYQHLMLMRHIREQWDHLLRAFEDDWCCKPCVQARTMLVQGAAVLINGAFTPFEVREAKAQQHLDHMQRSFERLTTFFRKMSEPQDHNLKRESE